MSQSGFPHQWARHIDAVWGQAQRRGPGQGAPAGPPAWMAGLFGLGQPETARGPKVRRGDVRSAILDVVRRADERGERVNGYQVIQQIADLSGEQWRPSPGSIYPTVAQLEDEGLLLTDEEAGRKALRLTEAGRAYVVEHRSVLDAVWEPFQAAGAPGAAGAAGSRPDLKPEIGQVMSAVWQIVTNGSSTQRAAAVEILVDTRRRLYGVLADGEPVDDAEALDRPDPGTHGPGDTDGTQGGARWTGGSW